MRSIVYGHKQASTYVNALPQCSPGLLRLAPIKGYWILDFHGLHCKNKFANYPLYISRFTNDALLGGGVRFRVGIREQRKIKGTSY